MKNYTVTSDVLNQLNTMGKFKSRQAEIDHISAELGELKKILSMPLVEWLEYTRHNDQGVNNEDHYSCKSTCDQGEPKKWN